MSVVIGFSFCLGGPSTAARRSDPGEPGGPTAITLALSTNFPAVGEAIEATPGHGAYQWFAGGEAIAGANAASYTPTSDDLGAALSVEAGGLEAETAGTVLPALPDAVRIDDLTSASRTTGSRRTIRGSTTFGVDGRAEARTVASGSGTFGLEVSTGETLAPSEIGTVVWSVRTEPGENAAGVVGRATQLYLSGAGGQTASGSEGAYDVRGRTLAANVAEMPGLADAPSGSFRMRMLTNRAGDGAAAVRVWNAYRQAEGRPTALIRFHDSREEAYTVAFPAMQARGLVGTLHLATGLVGTPRHLTWTQIGEMSAAGWTIALGTTDDAPWTDLPDPAAAVADWEAGRASVAGEDLPLDGTVHAYWTSGSYDPAIADALVGAGVETIHGLHPDTFHDRFGLVEGLRRQTPSQGARASTVLGDLTTWLDQASLRGTTASFHFHGITPEGSAIDVREDVFASFVETLAARRDAGEIEVLAVTDWWSRVRDAAPPAPTP